MALTLFSPSLSLCRHARALLGAVLLLTAPLAQAELKQTGWYGGFYYSGSTDRLEPVNGLPTEISKGHIKIKTGKQLMDHVSLEGQFGLTTNSGTKRGLLSYGVYLRPFVDIGRYRLYGLLGASGIYAYSDVVDNVSESGGSLGLGVEVFGGKNAALSLEYLRMIDKSVQNGKYSFETIGIGFSYYFLDDTSYFSRNRNKIKSIRY